MTPGFLTVDPATTSLTIGGGLVIFNEETQRLLCIHMNRTAAAAGGIDRRFKVE